MPALSTGAQRGPPDKSGRSISRSRHTPRTKTVVVASNANVHRTLARDADAPQTTRSAVTRSQQVQCSPGTQAVATQCARPAPNPNTKSSNQAVASFPVSCDDLLSDSSGTELAVRGAGADSKPGSTANRSRARTRRRTTAIRIPVGAAHNAATVVGPVGAGIHPPAQAKQPAAQSRDSNSVVLWLTAFVTLLAVAAVMPAARHVMHQASRSLMHVSPPASAPASAHTWAHVASVAGYAAGVARGLEASRSLLRPATYTALPAKLLAALTPSWAAAPGSRRGVITAAAGTGGVATARDGAPRWLASSKVRVISISPTTTSPYSNAPWDQVMSHISQRLTWVDPSFQMHSFTEQELAGDAGWSQFKSLMGQDCKVLLGADLSDPRLVKKLDTAAQAGQLPGIRMFLGSATMPVPVGLQQLNSLQGYQPQTPNAVDSFLARFSWSSQAKSAQLWSTTQDLWRRHSSDDLLFVYLVLINQYLTPVQEVAMTTKGFDLGSLVCMIKHCRQQIVDCVQNPVCKTALDCLQGCSFNDQVCQYRCIVSYETPQLEAFSLCILQKHNCRSLDAQPPMRPDPAPMSSFRGAPLTHEVAEDMLVGWMPPHPGLPAGQQPLPFSWLVAAGKNPAYDYFPCQHQLFYRGKAPGVLWYEPVFKAITLDNRQVWRRRRYRVRRGKVPGTFYFTVLDNGVTSNEFWRVLDCDESYEWCLFYYSGAASAAGLSYSGAVLGTHDGRYPTAPHTLTRLETALDRAGIKPWELSFVDNSACAGAPLQLAGQTA